MAERQPHHLTVNGQPYCGWTGCQAGRDIAVKSGVDHCSHTTKASAERAAFRLRPHFRRGAVKIAPGTCPEA